MRNFMWPREHGAYAQLTFPLLSGLVLGGPTLAGAALAAATVACFIAYEPVAVLTGVRGVRLQRAENESARRQLAILIPIAVVAGLAGLTAAPAQARLFTLVPAALCAVMALLLPARKVKTLAGETIVAAALASMHLPIAAAGGVHEIQLWGPPLVWFAGFSLATLVVHGVKARLKQRDGWIGIAGCVVGATGLIAAGALVFASGSYRIVGAALAIPMAAALAVSLARVHPRALKRVGWTLVAANFGTLLVFALLT